MKKAEDDAEADLTVDHAVDPTRMTERRVIPQDDPDHTVVRGLERDLWELPGVAVEHQTKEYFVVVLPRGHSVINMWTLVTIVAVLSSREQFSSGTRTDHQLHKALVCESFYCNKVIMVFCLQFLNIFLLKSFR